MKPIGCAEGRVLPKVIDCGGPGPAVLGMLGRVQGAVNGLEESWFVCQKAKAALAGPYLAR